ncbi:Endoribonuclease L-PSP/chorismate mutase-like protein [Obelidium mucronatum]|nr:Endoribonuclease L-PSP/chorismate mutase-like protein [Obelidium mucronatum]
MPLEHRNVFDHTLPFSHIVLDGEYAHVSGQLAQDPETRQLKAGTAEYETTRCMEQLVEILSSAELSLDNVTRVNLYITNLADFAEINAAYVKFFPSGKFPARTCVAVASLLGNTRIEIEATARLPQGHKSKL